MVWGIQVLVSEVCGRDSCCGTGVPVGCVATICRVVVTIATYGIGSVVGHHRLVAGVVVVTVVDLGGVCETGERFDACSSRMEGCPPSSDCIRRNRLFSSISDTIGISPAIVAMWICFISVSF